MIAEAPLTLPVEPGVTLEDFFGTLFPLGEALRRWLETTVEDLAGKAGRGGGTG